MDQLSEILTFGDWKDVLRLSLPHHLHKLENTGIEGYSPNGLMFVIDRTRGREYVDSISIIMVAMVGKTYVIIKVELLEGFQLEERILVLLRKFRHENDEKIPIFIILNVFRLEYCFNVRDIRESINENREIWMQNIYCFSNDVSKEGDVFITVNYLQTVKYNTLELLVMGCILRDENMSVSCKQWRALISDILEECSNNDSNSSRIRSTMFYGLMMIQVSGGIIQCYSKYCKLLYYEKEKSNQ